jgi:hypothetical protein
LDGYGWWNALVEQRVSAPVHEASLQALESPLQELVFWSAGEVTQRLTGIVLHAGPPPQLLLWT